MEKTRKYPALFSHKKSQKTCRQKKYFPGTRGPFAPQGSISFVEAAFWGIKERGSVPHTPFRAGTCWYNIVPFLTKEKIISTTRVDSWLLVLAAKDFSYYLQKDSPHPQIILLEKDIAAAVSEILEFEKEQTRPKVFALPRSVWPLLLVLLLLFLWHGLRFRWFPFNITPPFPILPEDWASAFGLDMYKTVTLGQWWRAFTALCLHNSTNHLLTNLIFGFVFMLPLCRRTGYGVGVFLVMTAGAVGNVCSALVQKPFVLSLGFSTAVFGAVGLLGAIACLDSLFAYGKGHPLFRKRIVIYGAALLGLFAMLGGAEKETTDSISHMMGLIAGVTLGVAVYYGLMRLQNYPPVVNDGIQLGFGFLTAASVVYAWFLGLQLLLQIKG